MSGRPLQLRFVSSATRTDQLPDSDAEVAFIGRSNVGKSSLINALANQKQLARVSNTPGRTQLINVFAHRDGATCIGGPEAGTLRARGDGAWVEIGGEVTGALTTLEWRGTARVFVDNVDHGEHAERFTHATAGDVHTYRIEIGTSRSGFVYANL